MLRIVMIDWRPLLRDLGILLLALLAAEVAQRLLRSAIHRAVRRRHEFLADAVVSYTSQPGRWLLRIVAISVAVPGLALTAPAAVLLRHFLEIGLIVTLAWLAVGCVQLLNGMINHRLPFEVENNLRARRIRTQVHLLHQIAIGVICFAALAAVLMTFPNIRSVGTGLFASAGLAGLALGMAARPALGNLIAGIQIAMTEPIRLDDVVIVEGEWGRIEELNTTYVVVRIWDQRRMVVPLTYFIEKPFENWTRASADLIGTVFLYIDYTAPVAEIREKYQEILKKSPLWDGKVSAVQVTDFKEHTMEVRFLMSAADSSKQFDLRCYVRESLISYLQQNYPQALPKWRLESSASRGVNGTAFDQKVGSGAEASWIGKR